MNVSGEPRERMEAAHTGAFGPSLLAADHRAVHVITRGNVDGIISAAVCFSLHPGARVSYVPSATGAAEVLRKDASSKHLILLDIGLTPELIETLNAKAGTDQAITLVDHHQQTGLHAHEVGPHVRVVIGEGGSAASVAFDHFELTDPALSRLVALADLVEYGTSEHLTNALESLGEERLEAEAAHLDFAWRLEVEDDRFRTNAGRRLARGAWPSEIGEVRRRYLTMVNENRWLKAKERVRRRLVMREGVALLNFGKRKPSLLGFGTRALTSVAKEEGARVAVLVNTRRGQASVALRAVGATSMNLGQFVEDFTREHGIVGGGHPTSAGAKINAQHLDAFLAGIYAHG